MISILDTSNIYGITAPDASDHIEITQVRLLMARGGYLSKTEALVLSAWLLAQAAPDTAAVVAEGSRGTIFGKILSSVLNS